VSGATSKQIGPAHGAAGGMTRLAYARAKQAGIEFEPLLKKVRLEQGQVEDVNARLRVRSQKMFGTWSCFCGRLPGSKQKHSLRTWTEKDPA